MTITNSSELNEMGLCLVLGTTCKTVDTHSARWYVLQNLLQLSQASHTVWDIHMLQTHMVQTNKYYRQTHTDTIAHTGSHPDCSRKG